MHHRPRDHRRDRGDRGRGRVLRHADLRPEPGRAPPGGQHHPAGGPRRCPPTPTTCGSCSSGGAWWPPGAAGRSLGRAVGARWQERVHRPTSRAGQQQAVGRRRHRHSGSAQRCRAAGQRHGAAPARPPPATTQAASRRPARGQSHPAAPAERRPPRRRPARAAPGTPIGGRARRRRPATRPRAAHPTRPGWPTAAATATSASAPDAPATATARGTGLAVDVHADAADRTPATTRSGGRAARPEGQGHAQRTTSAGGQLDQRVAGRDRGPAGAAAAPEDEPARRGGRCRRRPELGPQDGQCEGGWTTDIPRGTR